MVSRWLVPAGDAGLAAGCAPYTRSSSEPALQIRRVYISRTSFELKILPSRCIRGPLGAPPALAGSTLFQRDSGTICSVRPIQARSGEGMRPTDFQTARPAPYLGYPANSSSPPSPESATLTRRAVIFARIAVGIWELSANGSL